MFFFIRPPPELLPLERWRDAWVVSPDWFDELCQLGFINIGCSTIYKHAPSRDQSTAQLSEESTEWETDALTNQATTAGFPYILLTARILLMKFHCPIWWLRFHHFNTCCGLLVYKTTFYNFSCVNFIYSLQEPSNLWNISEHQK